MKTKHSHTTTDRSKNQIQLQLTIHSSDLLRMARDIDPEVNEFFEWLDAEPPKYSQVSNSPFYSVIGLAIMFDLQSDMAQMLIAYQQTPELTPKLKDYLQEYIRQTKQKAELKVTTQYKEKSNSGYVYVVKSQNLYKIGKAKKPKDRKKKYITENPNKIEMIICKKVVDYDIAEKELQKKFAPKQHRGEWFNLEKDDLQTIRIYLDSCRTQGN